MVTLTLKLIRLIKKIRTNFTREREANGDSEKYTFLLWY